MLVYIAIGASFITWFLCLVAGRVMAIAPVLMLFMVLQRYIVRALTARAAKG